MLGGAADAVRRPGGRARRGDRPTYAELAGAARQFGAALVGGGRRARRPGGDLVRQLRRVDGGGARPVRRRRGPGPGQHALQGRRGGGRPLAERRPRPRHRDRLPRAPTTWPCSRARARRCRRSRRSSSPEGDGQRTRRRRGADFLGTRHAGVAWPRSSAAAPRSGPDDPSDILFTSGTTGVPKGVVMTHGRTLIVATDWVAMTGLQRRRRLPAGEPVLPHVRPQGRHPGQRRQRRHHAARARLRRRPGPGPRRRRARHRPARAADALPVHPRPSRPRRSTTSRRCAWP